MSRIKSGKTTRRRHKRLLEYTKGFRHGRKNLFRLAKEAFLKAGKNAFIGRKLKKRDFRRLWIVKINAACRQNGLSYNRFIAGLEKAKINLNRKMLADLAENYPDKFKEIVRKVSQ